MCVAHAQLGRIDNRRHVVHLADINQRGHPPAVLEAHLERRPRREAAQKVVARRGRQHVLVDAGAAVAGGPQLGAP